MHPQGTRGYRASIVGRARLIEDLLAEEIQSGVHQYVVLGAGLDTFVQRKPELASKVQVFEIDEPPTQAWKQQRLKELGYGIPQNLHFVPVNFEMGEAWLEKLKVSGFKTNDPAFIASTGVTMYLTKEANMETFRKLSTLAPGSTYAMTFMLPPALVEPEDRAGYEFVMERTAAAGTPFLSLFPPEEIVQMARDAGFKSVKYVSRKDVIAKYFAGRADGLQPSSGEEFLIATT
jgi:methyltransferase (TIGR00027 family)